MTLEEQEWRDWILHSETKPVRDLTDWERDFVRGVKSWKNDKDLSELQSEKLAEVAALYE